MRIGLTGGIASGKSTIAARFAHLGAYVIDYDAIARTVVAPGGKALPSIVAEFGSDVLNSDGTLNRAWLAEQVFGQQAEPGARERLDAIEHPLIYREVACLENAQEKSRIVVHDIPLLAEVIDRIPFAFDHIVTVEAPEAERIKRMMNTRDMSRQQALDRTRHQSTQAQRQAIADTIIDSAQPMASMLQAVDRLYEQWI